MFVYRYEFYFNFILIDLGSATSTSTSTSEIARLIHCARFLAYTPRPPSLLAAQFEFVVVVVLPLPLLRVLSCLRVLLLISREFRKRRSLA